MLIASNWFAALRHILPPPTRPASPRSVNVPVAVCALLRRARLPVPPGPVSEQHAAHIQAQPWRSGVSDLRRVVQQSPPAKKKLLSIADCHFSLTSKRLNNATGVSDMPRQILIPQVPRTFFHPLKLAGI